MNDIEIRKSCKDVWGAKFCKGVKDFSENYDLPMSPSTTDSAPDRIITWKEAQTSKDHNAWVCFFEPPEEYDGKNGIWDNSTKALSVLSRYKGVISPAFGFSKRSAKVVAEYDILRSRSYAGWLGRNGLPVMNGLYWINEASRGMITDAIPEGSAVAISTIGYDRNDAEERRIFETGLNSIMEDIKPCLILVYGDYKDPYFTHIRQTETRVAFYDAESGLRIPEEVLPKLSCIPEIYPDFNAPVIPHKGLGGLTLGMHADALRSLIDAPETRFIEGGTWYGIDVEEKVRIYFRREDDRIFQISAHEGYRGTLEGIDVMNMKRRDFFSVWKNKFSYEDFEEVYYCISDGLCIDYDSEGNTVMLSVMDEKETNTFLS